MENPLSQSDIDAIMRALLPAGGEDLFLSKGNAVRPYDFRRPTKFKKDLLRTLVMIHDNFARLLQSFFMANLRTRVQMHVRGTNQYSYTEFMQLIPNPTVVGIFRMEPLPGTGLIEMSQNVAYAIIDRVFGGGGVDALPQRALSEIEIGVIQRMITDMLTLLQEAWRNVADVKPILEGMETNPAFLKASSPSEVVAAITIGFEIGEHMGHITLALPHAMVEPLMARLSGGHLLGTGYQSNGPDQRVSESLGEAPVEVCAYLGTTQITVGQVAEFQPGDVIVLPTLVGGDIAVKVGDSVAFYGRPGVVGKRMAVQVHRRLAVTGP